MPGGRRQRLGARADWRETASELRDQKTARGRTPCARRRSTTTPPRVPMPTTATPAPSVLPPEVASPAAADGTDARARRRDRKAPARGILPEFERSARAREASIRGRETATKGIRAVTTTAGATMMARETRGRECEARGESRTGRGDTKIFICRRCRDPSVATNQQRLSRSQKRTWHAYVDKIPAQGVHLCAHPARLLTLSRRLRS